ncbi:MAG TPA: glycerate kinase [Clostridiaceae bacterium]|nr:glycerate kinase [Clostridiaceae bacterium]
MKILLAPDSFKGTMSSIEVINILEKVVRQHFEDIEIIKVPIADGGEGTVDAIIAATGGEYREVEVSGPLSGQKVRARYGIINGHTAVIEMAQASGLFLIKPEQRNPLLTTSFGTGELIKAALDEGIRNFIIGIGGSATNDGGIGAAQALGVKFLDSNGENVGLGGGELSKIQKIDLTEMDRRIRDSNISVICDVTNPLTGPNGATAVYGPQKGVKTQETFEILEKGMKNYEKLIMDTTGMDMSAIPGSGAAGGLGATMVAFFGAVLKPGIETILDFVNFDNRINDVDLVITGEGKIDSQSVFGKVPVGIAERCKQKNVRVVAISGVMGKDASKVYKFGIDSIMTTINSDMCLGEALARAEELLEDAADRMFRFIKVGMALKK